MLVILEKLSTGTRGASSSKPGGLGPSWPALAAGPADAAVGLGLRKRQPL